MERTLLRWLLRDAWNASSVRSDRIFDEVWSFKRVGLFVSRPGRDRYPPSSAPDIIGDIHYYHDMIYGNVDFS